MLTRSMLIAVAALSVAACAAGCAPHAGLQPFKSDGCSLFPDRALVGKADWCSCCLAHDLAYWRGGTEDERLSADRAFEACVVARTGDKVLATTMFNGVRAGGGPEIGTPFRWGYGWAYGRGYKALTREEASAADALEAEYRARKDPDACGRPPA